MTRAEQLRFVADVVELLDERFPGKFEAEYKEDLQETREALGAAANETLVEAAQRVFRECAHARSQLAQAEPYANELERVYGQLKKAELSCEGEREFRRRAEKERDEALDGQKGPAKGAVDTIAVSVLSKISEILQAPIGEDVAVVAERRMTSIRDLVAKADAYDKQMAEALSGLYAGDDAPTAVKKLVDATRRLANENADLKEKIERLGV
jgi:hypothetical protein